MYDNLTINLNFWPEGEFMACPFMGLAVFLILYGIAQIGKYDKP